jgi:predicted DCC family thiol-disulfide oxidoreductase YuxK
MSTPARSQSAAVVLFDGVCPLCHAAVRWIVRHDPGGQFRCAPLDSEVGRAVLEGAGALPPRSEPETVVLVEDGRVWERSDAILRIASGVGAPWRWLAVLRLLPRGLRDAAYGWVARGRYRWFGRLDACPLPPPELRDRFLG